MNHVDYTIALNKEKPAFRKFFTKERYDQIIADLTNEQEWLLIRINEDLAGIFPYGWGTNFGLCFYYHRPTDALMATGRQVFSGGGALSQTIGTTITNLAGHQKCLS